MAIIHASVGDTVAKGDGGVVFLPAGYCRGHPSRLLSWSSQQAIVVVVPAVDGRGHPGRQRWLIVLAVAVTYLVAEVTILPAEGQDRNTLALSWRRP